MGDDGRKLNGIVENLKKSTAEMLILALLDKEDMHTSAIIGSLDELSGGVCKIAFPYSAIYRLLDNNLIYECGKRFDSNRRRQYYRITPEGRKYFEHLKNEFLSYTNGVNMIFSAISSNEDEAALESEAR